MLAAGLFAVGAIIAWCIAYSALAWCVVAIDEHRRDKARRGRLADLSGLYRKDRN
jgi:hypothetical protein